MQEAPLDRQPDDNELGMYEASVLPPPSTPPPHPVLWLWYLFTQPGRFFSHFTTMTTRFTVVYTAWVYGIAGVMDRISGQILKNDALGHDGVLGPLMQNWGGYWAVCLVGGVLAGAITYAVGGLWYSVRLRFSGVQDLDEALARRVYVYAGLIWALPIVLIALRATAKFDTPLLAEHGSHGLLIDLLPMIALAWSVYVSYRGVRTVFSPSPWKARLWFVILPGILYIGIIVAALAVGLFSAFATRPLVEMPTALDRPGFSLIYPGNWWVDDTDEDYDPDTSFGIEPAQDATVRFEFQEPLDDTDAAVDRYMQVFLARFDEPSQPQPFSRWGVLRGSGREFTGKLNGNPYKARAFIFTDQRQALAIFEIAELDQWDELGPGFEQIRESFRLKQ